MQSQISAKLSLQMFKSPALKVIQQSQPWYQVQNYWQTRVRAEDRLSGAKTSNQWEGSHFEFCDQREHNITHIIQLWTPRRRKILWMTSHLMRLKTRPWKWKVIKSFLLMPNTSFNDHKVWDHVAEEENVITSYIIIPTNTSKVTNFPVRYESERSHYHGCGWITP